MFKNFIDSASISIHQCNIRVTEVYLGIGFWEQPFFLKSLIRKVVVLGISSLFVI